MKQRVTPISRPQITSAHAYTSLCCSDIFPLSSSACHTMSGFQTFFIFRKTDTLPAVVCYHFAKSLPGSSAQAYQTSFHHYSIYTLALRLNANLHFRETIFPAHTRTLHDTITFDTQIRKLYCSLTWLLQPQLIMLCTYSATCRSADLSFSRP